jgi:hypothetical protein
MKRLVPIPRRAPKHLEKEKQTKLGYQFVSGKLKDGRFFEQVVTSEGCIIQVKGHKDIPFTEAEVESVEIIDKPWNLGVRLMLNAQSYECSRRTRTHSFLLC